MIRCRAKETHLLHHHLFAYKQIRSHLVDGQFRHPCHSRNCCCGRSFDSDGGPLVEVRNNHFGPRFSFLCSAKFQRILLISLNRVPFFFPRKYVPCLHHIPFFFSTKTKTTTVSAAFCVALPCRGGQTKAYGTEILILFFFFFGGGGSI